MEYNINPAGKEAMSYTLNAINLMNVIIINATF